MLAGDQRFFQFLSGGYPDKPLDVELIAYALAERFHIDPGVMLAKPMSELIDDLAGVSRLDEARAKSRKQG